MNAFSFMVVALLSLGLVVGCSDEEPAADSHPECFPDAGVADGSVPFELLLPGEYCLEVREAARPRD